MPIQILFVTSKKFVLKSSGIYVVETYLPPVVVCSREEEENLSLLHPDLLSLLRDVLEVIVDHDKDLSVSLLHPDPHPDGVVEDTGLDVVTCQDMAAVMITPTLGCLSCSAVSLTA